MNHILSGIQPTGRKHVGNYFGAIRQYAALQDKGEAYYCIVDLHALTVLPDPCELRKATLETAALLIAAGLDAERCTLFVQSHVAGPHAELAWLLNCVASYGQMARMTQFKDKSDNRKHVSVGLFTYPVLQAADILLYDANIVPIGADQKQHLELTRAIAERFNSLYGGTFVIPEPQFAEVGTRLCDLQSPTKKMSTSSESDKGTIFVLDDPDVITNKVQRAVTDDGSEVFSGTTKPGITNLLQLMSAATGESVSQLEDRYRSSGYGTLKASVAEAVVEALRPVRERYHQLVADLDSLSQLLTNGAAKARDHAESKVAQVRQLMGCGQ